MISIQLLMLSIGNNLILSLKKKKIGKCQLNITYVYLKLNIQLC